MLLINPDIVIRKANLEDIDLLTDLSITTFTESYAAMNTAENMKDYIETNLQKQTLHAELLDNRNLFFIAVFNNIPVGYSKLRTGFPLEVLNDRNALEIARIYVLKKYQRQKAGAALIVHSIDYAVANSFEVIWLGVWEHNHKALKFYYTFGFEDFSSHIFQFGNDAQTDRLLKKEVNSI